MQSAAQSAVSSISNVNARLPINCSVGVREYCIGYSQNISCHTLPLNLSSLIPNDAIVYLKDQMNELRALDTALQIISPAYLQRPLSVGLVFLLLTVSMFFLDNMGYVKLPFKGVCFGILGLFYIVPFAISAVVLIWVQFKLRSLSFLTLLRQREAESLSLLALCFGVCISVLTVGTNVVANLPF